MGNQHLKAAIIRMLWLMTGYLDRGFVFALPYYEYPVLSADTLQPYLTFPHTACSCKNTRYLRCYMQSRQPISGSETWILAVLK